MTKKIDEKLLVSFACSTCKTKINCLLLCNDLCKTKNYLKEQKIDFDKEYSFINALSLNLTEGEVFTLAQKNFVSYLVGAYHAQALMKVSRGILGVDAVKESGSGVTIAYIDTGIHPHPDFILGENRIKYFKDFVNEKKSPYDDNGHGTFVAGAGSGSGALSGFKYAGVANKSSIISLKALDGKGEASSTRILEAMQWVYDNYKKFGIRIVCMSFGSEPLGISDPIMKGAEALWREGIVITAAAGNSGPMFDTIKSPGISSKIITVGGFNDNRLENDTFNSNFFEIADFSSRGPAMRRSKPDVIAPAVSILSCGVNKAYVELSGTSVATPMIAGLCALILEKAKNMAPDDVKRLLLSYSLAITYNKNIEGFGIPSILKIMQSPYLKQIR